MKARYALGCAPCDNLSVCVKTFLRAACALLSIVAGYPSFALESNEPMVLKDARLAGQFEVTALERVTEGLPQEVSVCRDWVLTSKDAKQFFAHAELLDPTVWHHTYDILPCGYSGWLSVGGLDYQFSINAGGFGSIKLSSGREDHILYSCKRGCDSLFEVSSK